ncbi:MULTISPECIES: hypothetical protein [unclassified Streptomyces]|uniref:hypothetical protein n=1 Tax=unclassified Streptomyces TaxID=2593676 RepID=UPI00093AB6A0|nr:hypothetical protein [Streptomyces sp. CB01249]OKI95418.1 hypothetical protein AMK18_27830 [Streptomyces sp. CB01249]
MRWDRGSASGLGLIVGGLVVGAVGVGIVTVGTGAFGVETETFSAIDCDSVSVKGGTVWHCRGESPDQAAANEAARRKAELDALRGVDDLRGPSRPQRTELMFVQHDGRRDPDRVTASHSPVGDRWIAHSGGVVGTGVGGVVVGGAGIAWGVHRTRTRRG